MVEKPSKKAKRERKCQTQDVLQFFVVNGDNVGCNQPRWAEAHFFSQVQQILPPERAAKTLTCQDKLQCDILV